MSEKKQRKVYSPEFKAKVGLEALNGVKTINEIGQEYGVHPIQEQAASLFEGKHGPKPTLGLIEYFAFYNGERPYQSLSNLTPDQVYRSGRGGGALIVDKFIKEGVESGTNEKSGQRRTAVGEAECTA